MPRAGSSPRHGLCAAPDLHIATLASGHAVVAADAFAKWMREAMHDALGVLELLESKTSLVAVRCCIPNGLATPVASNAFARVRAKWLAIHAEHDLPFFRDALMAYGVLFRAIRGSTIRM
jgi:hypothetical protein